MELKLKPAAKNSHPLGALLIKGTSAEGWLHDLQRTGLSLSAVPVYPLPGAAANTVWGCLAVADFEKNRIDAGRAGFCQRVHNLLFIPEGAALYPQPSADELAKLLGGKPHFFHPEIGLVALEEAVDWTSLLHTKEMAPPRLQAPTAAPHVPSRVKSFQVKQSSVDETLTALEQGHFPKPQNFSDKPLNPFEKAKLFLFRQLFTKAGAAAEGGTSSQGGYKKPGWMDKLFSKKMARWMDGLQQDLEELERRNQKHLDRLMDLLKKDPLEALKYALPLDGEGTGRGGTGGTFDLEKRWADFSLFGGFGGGGGSASLGGDAYWQLHRQYTQTAEELIRQKDYRKAAFVYMKLLKNYRMAAQTLEEGGYHAEAAAVYLKYCEDKLKAAECFEKAAQYEAAVELHKGLGNHEKVGDLYLRMAQKKNAFVYYQKVVDDYEANHQYLKASLLLKGKMQNEAAAQDALLKGWRLNRDAFNCLNTFFANHANEKALGEAMDNLYRHELTPTNREVFLRVLQHQYGKHPSLNQPVRDMSYEIISSLAASNPSIVSELRTFNKDDRQLAKDTMRFKVNGKKG